MAAQDIAEVVPEWVARALDKRATPVVTQHDLQFAIREQQL
jgi:hypothetical protein